MRKQVEFQAFLGPEVNGVTLASQAVLDLTNDDIAARKIVTTSHAGRLRSEVSNLFQLRRGCTLYRTLSGGQGVVFDLIVVLAALFAGVGRYVFHHHSYAYLNDESRLHRLVFRLTAKRSTHVVLAEEMGASLTTRYGLNPESTVVADNLGLLDLREVVELPNRGPALSVGMMSNLTVEKGADDFLELASKLVDRFGDSIRIDLAGPVSGELAPRVAKFASEFPLSFTAWGPVHGVEKDRFLSTLDVFVFPTKYRNEAQPLVLYEAILAGCDVVAYRRGAIGSQLAPFSQAQAVGDSAEMLDSVAAALDATLACAPEERLRQRSKRQAAAVDLRAARRVELQGLFRRLFN